MVTTRPPKTIVKPTALGPVANTDTKLLIYGLFQRGRVLAQDAVAEFIYHYHGELNHQGLGNAFVFLDTTGSLLRSFSNIRSIVPDAVAFVRNPVPLAQRPRRSESSPSEAAQVVRRA